MNKYINQNTARMEKILATSAKSGLSSTAVKERLLANGKNALLPKKRNAFFVFLSFAVSTFGIFSMAGALVLAWYFLPLTAFVAATVAYGVILLFWILLSFYREKAILDLRQKELPCVKVIRDGRTRYVSPEDLVIGDLMVLSAGDILYADAHVATDEEIEVFCERNGARGVMVKHGGACFDETEESFNLLCKGDIIRVGDALAFVTQTASEAPPFDKRALQTVRRKSKVCRFFSVLTVLLSLLTVVIAYFTTEGSAFALVCLSAAALIAFSPVALCELLLDCIFLHSNRKNAKKKGVSFSSLHAVGEAAKADCFLLPTKSVFHGSRFVLRSFECMNGERIAARSGKNSPELSLISSALVSIHDRYSIPGCERFLLDFCRAHSENGPALALQSLAVSSQYADFSVASFAVPSEGRSFSFVGGDPELLLPYALYVSDMGRTRLLDEKSGAALLSDIRRLKKNGCRLMAYAETQLRVVNGTFPRLVRDMKLLGFFILNELPDGKITDTLRTLVREKKRVFLFHDGDDPSWVTSSLPLLADAPVMDGNSESFCDEIRVFAMNRDITFAIGIHMTAQKQAQVAKMMEMYGYTTMAAGSSFAEHRLMCSASLAIAPSKAQPEKCRGLSYSAASVYSDENITAQTESVFSARRLLGALKRCAMYLSIAALARGLIFLLGVLFGQVLLPPFIMMAFSFIVDLLAVWAICRASSSVLSARVRGNALLAGMTAGALTLGGIAAYMASHTEIFTFSYVSFVILSLLLLLNVGILRFLYSRITASALLLPFFSCILFALYLLYVFFLQGGFSFNAELPFWSLLPTVSLLAFGGFFPAFLRRLAENKRNTDEINMTLDEIIRGDDTEDDATDDAENENM